MSTSRPSVAVLVSGIVAILGSAFAILGTGFTIQALYLIPRPPTVPAMPAYVQTIASASMLIFLGIAVFGVFTGIGVIRLKNWARIAIPIFSGLAVLFGGMALLFLAAMPFPVNPTGPPVNPVVVKGMLLTVHAIPVVIGIWWLILFNLKSAKAQFAGTASEASTGIPSVPACPLPVQIIAVFFLFSVLWMLVVPFMQMPFPAVFFGHPFYGASGKVLLVLAAPLGVGAVGLVKLKKWSYPLILGLQGFWLLSGTVTMLTPAFPRLMQEMMSQMRLPENIPWGSWRSFRRSAYFSASWSSPFCCFIAAGSWRQLRQARRSPRRSLIPCR